MTSRLLLCVNVEGDKYLIDYYVHLIMDRNVAFTHYQFSIVLTAPISIHFEVTISIQSHMLKLALIFPFVW